MKPNAAAGKTIEQVTMATTHQQVTKVWIAPGCIVCDACETECPDVFDVQEETCVIRPEAQKSQFTQPLTPSIIAAAESCPVEVIKFETVEVEGEAPWAAQEAEREAQRQAAGAGAGAHAAAGKPAAEPISTTPPDPRWLELVEHANVSRGQTQRPSVELPRSVKAPAAAVAAMLPGQAPPDAVAAAAAGLGYARPLPGPVERIRRLGAALSGAGAMSRRQFNVALAVAWGSIAAVGATCLAAFQSFMVPKVTKEPPSTFRAGRLGDYAEPGVYEQFKPQGVWIVRLRDSRLVAVSTICTHLGCIPNWLPTDQKFKCPCHGSGFYANGVNFEGPAPRPLERLRIFLEGDVVMVDKSVKYRQELGQWEAAGSFLQV